MDKIILVVLVIAATLTECIVMRKSREYDAADNIAGLVRCVKAMVVLGLVGIATAAGVCGDVINVIKEIAMTKELLEQYPDICAEIEELKAKDSAAVSDVVQASADEFPFNLHSVTVQGLPNPKHAERIRELEVQKAEIEAFVGRLAYRPQKLARCVMKHGTRWKVIMREMGGYKSPEALRKEFSRIFKKI